MRTGSGRVFNTSFNNKFCRRYSTKGSKGGKIATKNDLDEENSTRLEKLFNKPSRNTAPCIADTQKESELLKEEEHPTQPSETSISATDLVVDDAFHVFPLLRSTPEIVPVIPGTQQPAEGYARHKLEIQYKGTKYYGWLRRQLKSSLPTVQEAVEDTVSIACDLGPVDVMASVVPEQGIHCRSLTCHVDIPADHILPAPRNFLQRCRAWLKKREDEIAILSFSPAEEGFHAARSVLRRTYVYRILNRIAYPLLDDGNMQWHVDRALDVPLMQKAALLMEGEHDFGGFADHRVTRCLRRHGTVYTVKAVEKIRVTKQGDEVLIWISGKSFLRSQLRNMVAALVMVGNGAWSLTEIEYFLSKGFQPGREQNRIRPEPAPAHGLTLWDVYYPKE